MLLKELGIDDVVLGQALRNARKRAKLTQEELAEMLPCSNPSYLSKLENGKKAITYEWIYLYGAYTKCGTDAIFIDAFYIAGKIQDCKLATGIPLFDCVSGTGKALIYSNVISVFEYENDSEEKYRQRVTQYQKRVDELESKYRKDSLN